MILRINLHYITYQSSVSSPWLFLSLSCTPLIITHHSSTHHTHCSHIYIFMQLLIIFPKLSQPTFCTGSHCSLTSSTCTHPVTKIYKPLLFPLNHTTFLHSPLPLQYFLNICCKHNFVKKFVPPFCSITSTLDPLTTLYTQN